MLLLAAAEFNEQEIAGTHRRPRRWRMPPQRRETGSVGEPHHLTE